MLVCKLLVVSLSLLDVVSILSIRDSVVVEISCSF